MPLALNIAVMPVEGEAGRLELESDGEGSWRADSEPRPELEGCIDVDDQQATPFTAASDPPPRPGQDESREIRVACVRVPELTVEPAEQRYMPAAARA